MWTSITMVGMLMLGWVEFGYGDVGSSADPIIVYRPGTGMICPPRAVCADIFDYRVTLGGVTRMRSRLIFNCRCSNSTREACPIDDDHMLHSSPNHKQFLCRTAESLPQCELGKKIRPDIAEEMEEQPFMFGGINYFRINCICPLHMTPSSRIEGRLQRATQYYRTDLFRPDHRIFTQYKCKEFY